MKQDRNKKAFLYYVDWAEAMLELPNALRLKIDDALKRYVLYGEIPTDPEVKYSMFAMMRLKIDKDMKTYSDKCDRISKLRSDAGKNHSGNQYSRLEQTEQMEQMELDTVTDTDKKKKELSNESKKSASRFSPPSLEEIKIFAESEGLEVDAASFFDYYESNGWKVGGKATMKNWKAAVRNWNRREKEFAKPQPKQNNYDARRGNMEVTATNESDYKTKF